MDFNDLEPGYLSTRLILRPTDLPPSGCGVHSANYGFARLSAGNVMYTRSCRGSSLHGINAGACRAGPVG